MAAGLAAVTLATEVVAWEVEVWVAAATVGRRW